MVVDTQKLITYTGLYKFWFFESRVKELIKKARTNGIEVINIRHDAGKGNELTRGTAHFLAKGISNISAAWHIGNNKTIRDGMYKKCNRIIAWNKLLTNV